jgi:hypothetical protein
MVMQPAIGEHLWEARYQQIADLLDVYVVKLSRLGGFY